jgi:hypothetical protein
MRRVPGVRVNRQVVFYLGAQGIVCRDGPTVHARPERVPADGAPSRFLSDLIQHVLSASPMAHDVRVCSFLERRAIPVPEADTDDEALPSYDCPCRVGGVETQ